MNQNLAKRRCIISQIYLKSVTFPNPDVHNSFQTSIYRMQDKEPLDSKIEEEKFLLSKGHKFVDVSFIHLCPKKCLRQLKVLTLSTK